MSFFLPYNPAVLSYDPDIEAECKKWWPKCTFSHAAFQKCDLLWIDNNGAELEILQKYHPFLQHTTAIYTTTHANYYPALKAYLEAYGFTLLSHWYQEGESGCAVFIKKHIFDAAMRTLNYFPSGGISSFPFDSYELSRFFRKPLGKTGPHQMEAIDFIYMINLDERPEKFAEASFELELYGIYPYRFSAVNGWKLRTSDINQVGAKFFPGMVRQEFMGSLYIEIDGEEYLSSELIQGDGRAYFTLGMSHGSIGIALSHLSVLQDAYDSGYETIWVMEDDVEVLENPQQIPSLIRKLDQIDPDWDVFFTDIDTKDKKGNRVPCRALAARPNVAQPPLDHFFNLFYRVDDDFSRYGMRYGAYSMIIRRSGMKKILDYFNAYGIFLPYDMDFWLADGIKLYSVNRDIVSTRVGALSDNDRPNYRLPSK